MNNLDIDDILSAVNNMNDGESVQNILGDLHHRSPVVKTVDSSPCPPSSGRDNNNSKGSKQMYSDVGQRSKQTINRPVDPTGSVSSSDNSAPSNVADTLDGVDDQKLSNMKQMLQSISSGQSQRQIRTQKMPTGSGVSASRSEGSKQQQSGGKKKSVSLNVAPDESGDQADVGAGHEGDQGDDGSQKQDNGTVVPAGDALKSHMTSLMGYNIPTTTLYFIIVMIIIAVALYFLTAEKKRDKEKEKEKEKQKKKESE